MESTSPQIMQVFDRYYAAGKKIYGEISKKIRSGKALQLEDQLFFLRLFLLVLDRARFGEKEQLILSFRPFKELYKQLRKVQHIKMIKEGYDSYFGHEKSLFSEYGKAIAADKKSIYTHVYEIILSISPQDWENLYQEVYRQSRGLSILTVNTAITQIINEELEYFYFDSKTKLDPQSIHDIYKGIKKVIFLEKIRLNIGLNTIFTPQVHEQVMGLENKMAAWHRNQLLLQHLGNYLAKKEKVSKKFQPVITKLQQSHKGQTQIIADRCRRLFVKMLH
ncbi:hypothetical protein SAMN04488057_11672 [Cyclobacterium lianum]|uniref:CHAD domain-containing protein n=1 Tax=Cyclobacterium lianum TaxID=388280 RepID=A0A1M7QCP6_9BACT|nr:hypothetical protein [Cyclobacterium lianum]SHN28520.1 hypothetical protein SAMN04488057_11672 [Cyclobacterium lianum]